MKPGIDYTGVSVVMLCHDGQGRLLMHKRSQNCRDEQGKWDCGGGKLEFGENLSQAVLREVKEEYGCEGQIDQQLASYAISREKEGKVSHWVAVPFIIRVDPAKAMCNEPASMEEVGWFALSQLPEPYHPGLDLILREHRDSLKTFFS